MALALMVIKKTHCQTISFDEHKDYSYLFSSFHKHYTIYL